MQRHLAMKLINNTLLKTCVIAAFSFLLLAEPASAARTCSPRAGVGGGDILIDDVQRCPSNYHDMGVSRAPGGGSTGNSNPFDGFNTSAQCDVTVLGDCARAVIPERSAAIVRGIKGAAGIQAADSEIELQQRQSEIRRNTRLPPDSKCLAGSWRITLENGRTSQIPLTISQNGTLHLNDKEISSVVTYMNDSFSFADGLANDSNSIFWNASRGNDDVLIGAADTDVQVKGKRVYTRDALTYSGVRISEIPSGCSTNTIQSTSPSPTAGERGSNLVENLNNLSELYQNGILTDEEFNAAKRRLLGL